MINLNEYFEGRVKSLATELNGQKFSIGIIEPGEYTFGTQEKELMEIIQGEMEVVNPTDIKRTYSKGESFKIPQNSEFTVKVNAPTSYICLYG
jgi:uncharacterized protein YaiE (UPF0345 family)